MWWAASKGRTEVVEMLLAHGANVDPLGRDEVQEARTPLWIAASFGHMAVVEALLRTGADASLCNSEGCSPMRAAVEGRHLQVVVLLAPHGADAADINRIWFGRTTLLCIAAEEGRNELVEALLQAGANVNTSDADGKSPLWWAACKGHTEVMEVLLTHGAGVDSPDEVRASPIAPPLPFVSTSGGLVRGRAA